MNDLSDSFAQANETAIANAVAFRLNPVQWIGGDGRKTYHVSEMETSHLVNCIKLMESGHMKRQVTNGLTQKEWVQVFRNELIARLHVKK